MSNIIHLITESRYPAFYEIGISDCGNIFTIKLREESWDFIKNYIEHTDQINNMRQSFSEVTKLPLPNFVKPNDNGWTFGNTVFKKKHKKKKWIHFYIDISHTYNNPQLLREFLAILEITFSCLFQFDDAPYDSDEPSQLLHDIIIESVEGRRYNIEVLLSREMIKCISDTLEEQDFDNIFLADIEETMLTVYKNLISKQDIPHIDTSNMFKVYIHKPFNIHIPYFENNGLDPSLTHETDANNMKGYKLYSHNIDYSMQQVVLYAGLCKFHMMARQAGY